MVWYLKLLMLFSLSSGKLLLQYKILSIKISQSLYYKSTLSVALKLYIWIQSGHLRSARLFCIVSAPGRIACTELHFGFIPLACVEGRYTKQL